MDENSHNGYAIPAMLADLIRATYIEMLFQIASYARKRWNSVE